MKWMMLRSSANLMSRSTMTLWTPISRLSTWRKYELARHNTIWKNKGTVSSIEMKKGSIKQICNRKPEFVVLDKFHYMCLIFDLMKQTDKSRVRSVPCVLWDSGPELWEWRQWRYHPSSVGPTQCYSGSPFSASMDLPGQRCYLKYITKDKVCCLHYVNTIKDLPNKYVYYCSQV